MPRRRSGHSQIYGSLQRGVLAIWNAVDQQRYDIASRIHRFKPVIDHYGAAGERIGKPA